MKLFSLWAELGLDWSGFSKGVKNASDQGKGLAASLSGSFATISAKTIALGNAMYDASKQLARFAVDAAKSIVNEYAATEQLVGGIETLFKDSAQTVISASSEAFRTAGMSANEYMETVTSFSASLLKGLDGDTAAAASVADMAIQDMADNANKMGTSMALIQNAYQGFAKDNFTMLDNLKLGYGGTAAEMAKLINDSGVLGKTLVTASNVSEVPLDKMFEAIHIIQTEMDITGTTAKEAASTISGSFNAFKASWKNLLSGMASDKDVDKLMDDLFDTGEIMVNNVLNLLPRIGKNIISGVDSLLEKWDFYSLLKNAYNVGGWDAVWDAATATVKRKLGEWGESALETGATFTANLISGITGEEINSDDVKAKATEIFGAFGDAAVDVLDIGKSFFSDLFAEINSDSTSPGLIGDKISGVFDVGVAAMDGLVTAGGKLLSRLYAAVTEDTESAENLEAFFTELGDDIKAVGSGFGSIAGAMVDGYTVLFQELADKWEKFKGEHPDLFNPDTGDIEGKTGGTTTGGHIAGTMLGVAALAASRMTPVASAMSAIAAAITSPEVTYYKPPAEESYDELKAAQERKDTGKVLKSQTELMEMLGTLAASGKVGEAQYYEWFDVLRFRDNMQEYTDVARDIMTLWSRQDPLVDALYKDIDIDLSELIEAQPHETVLPQDDESEEDISGAVELLNSTIAELASLPDRISAALSGIGITMDGVTVGNLILPTVSAGIARMNRFAAKTAT